ASVALLHAVYYLALAERAEPELSGAAQAAWLRRLEQEHDNLRAALDWATAGAAEGVAAGLDGAMRCAPPPCRAPGATAGAGHVELGLRLAGTLERFWEERGYRQEAYRRLTSLLRLPGARARTGARAKALRALGQLTAWRGDYPEAHSLLLEC